MADKRLERLFNDPGVLQGDPVLLQQLRKVARKAAISGMEALPLDAFSRHVDSISKQAATYAAPARCCLAIEAVMAPWGHAEKVQCQLLGQVPIIR